MCAQPAESHTDHQANRPEHLRRDATLRRLRQQIAVLSQPAPPVESREQINGVEVVQDVALRRTRLYFTGVPSAVVRHYLTAHGFRWSQYEGCWQRNLSLQALALARKAATLVSREG